MPFSKLAIFFILQLEICFKDKQTKYKGKKKKKKNLTSIIILDVNSLNLQLHQA